MSRQSLINILEGPLLRSFFVYPLFLVKISIRNRTNPHKVQKNPHAKQQKTIAYEAYLWYNILNYIILFVLQERRENW